MERRLTKLKVNENNTIFVLKQTALMYMRAMIEGDQIRPGQYLTIDHKWNLTELSNDETAKNLVVSGKVPPEQSIDQWTMGSGDSWATFRKADDTPSVTQAKAIILDKLMIDNKYSELRVRIDFENPAVVQFIDANRDYFKVFSHAEADRDMLKRIHFYFSKKSEDLRNSTTLADLINILDQKLNSPLPALMIESIFKEANRIIPGCVKKWNLRKNTVSSIRP